MTKDAKRRVRREVCAYPRDVAVFLGIADAMRMRSGELFSRMLEHYRTCPEVPYDLQDCQPFNPLQRRK